MKCIRPTKFPNSNTHVTCGQCMPCRITRRNEWHTKLMLEWQTWKKGVFTTLTYAPEELPQANKYKGGSVCKKDMQDFMKRFRINYKNKYGYTKVRFFGVAEYGDRFKRAHMHIIIFNVEPDHAEKIINMSWTKGITKTDLLNENRIKYTIGYTIKKETNEKDFPDGRQPEFSMMSRKPALGWYALPRFAKTLKKRGLYPTRSLENYHKWILEQKGIQVKPWNGTYRQNGKYYRFDNNMMKKLAELAYPEYKEIAIKNESLFYEPEYKARKKRLHDDSYLDTIKFVTSAEKENEQKKAEKQKRANKKNLF